MYVSDSQKNFLPNVTNSKMIFEDIQIRQSLPNDFQFKSKLGQKKLPTMPTRNKRFIVINDITRNDFDCTYTYCTKQYIHTQTIQLRIQIVCSVILVHGYNRQLALYVHTQNHCRWSLLTTTIYFQVKKTIKLKAACSIIFNGFS